MYDSSLFLPVLFEYIPGNDTGLSWSMGRSIRSPKEIAKQIQDQFLQNKSDDFKEEIIRHLVKINSDLSLTISSKSKKGVIYEYPAIVKIADRINNNCLLRIARSLGLEYHEMDCFRNDYPNDLRARIHAALEEAVSRFEKNGKSSDEIHKIFFEALKNEGNLNAAQECLPKKYWE